MELDLWRKRPLHLPALEERDSKSTRLASKAATPGVGKQAVSFLGKAETTP